MKDEFGMAGYGAYWAILEAIAEQMTPENDTPKLQLSVKNWRKITEFSPKKFQLFVTFLQKNGLFEVKCDGVMVGISCPNLLKIRDEYSRKANKKGNELSGQCPPPSVSPSPSPVCNLIVLGEGEVPDYDSPYIMNGATDSNGDFWKYDDGVLVNTKTGLAHVDISKPLDGKEVYPF